jgi:hypothetical protein
MNIKDLNGKILKKELNCKSCHYRWHNKNNSGGNFGINILGIENKDFELSGNYDKNGSLGGLRFGYLFCAGHPLIFDSFNELIEFMKKRIKSMLQET